MKRAAFSIIQAIEQAVGSFIENFHSLNDVVIPKGIRDSIIQSDKTDTINDKSSISECLDAAYLKQVLDWLQKILKETSDGRLEIAREYTQFLEKIELLQVRTDLYHPVRTRGIDTTESEYLLARCYAAATHPAVNELKLDSVPKAIESVKNRTTQEPTDEWLEKYYEQRDIKNNLREKATKQGIETKAFVGRLNEIKEIKKSLLDTRSNTTALIGEGGSGKTALAIHVLNLLASDRKAAERFEQILLVSAKFEKYQDVKNSRIKPDFENVTQVKTAIASELMPEDANSTWEKAEQAFKSKEIIVCLDNMETIIGQSQDALRDLIYELPEKWHFIVTSRLHVNNANQIRLRDLQRENKLTIVRKYSALAGSNLDNAFVEEIADKLEFPLQLETASRILASNPEVKTLQDVNRAIESVSGPRYAEFALSNLVTLLSDQGIDAFLRLIALGKSADLTWLSKLNPESNDELLNQGLRELEVFGLLQNNKVPSHFSLRESLDYRSVLDEKMSGKLDNYYVSAARMSESSSLKQLAGIGKESQRTQLGNRLKGMLDSFQGDPLSIEKLVEFKQDATANLEDYFSWVKLYEKVAQRSPDYLDCLKDLHKKSKDEDVSEIEIAVAAMIAVHFQRMKSNTSVCEICEPYVEIVEDCCASGDHKITEDLQLCLFSYFHAKLFVITDVADLNSRNSRVEEDNLKQADNLQDQIERIESIIHSDAWQLVPAYSNDRILVSLGNFYRRKDEVRGLPLAQRVQSLKHALDICAKISNTRPSHVTMMQAGNLFYDIIRASVHVITKNTTDEYQVSYARSLYEFMLTDSAGRLLAHSRKTKKDSQWFYKIKVSFKSVLPEFDDGPIDRLIKRITGQGLISEELESFGYKLAHITKPFFYPDSVHDSKPNYYSYAYARLHNDSVSYYLRRIEFSYLGNADEAEEALNTLKKGDPVAVLPDGNKLRPGQNCNVVDFMDLR
ncbi:MAG: hypothetical protein CMJ40_06160 [Phycisphaerae bacterium]|nr:hypothetical protein [Phycisphaerae bacterium]